MVKISKAIRETILSSQFFEWGISYDLINLSKLALYIQPILESRLKKEVSINAIKMNLSRLKSSMMKTAPKLKNFKLDNLTINSDLAILTYTKTKEIHEKINSLYGAVLKENGYISITEGVHQITIIINEKFLKKAQSLIGFESLCKCENVVAIGVEFIGDYTYTPGLFYSLMQKIALQNINILEISSTHTELIFYFDEKDLKMAFDTILNNYTR